MAFWDFLKKQHSLNSNSIPENTPVVMTFFNSKARFYESTDKSNLNVGDTICLRKCKNENDDRNVAVYHNDIAIGEMERSADEISVFYGLEIKDCFFQGTIAKISRKNFNIDIKWFEDIPVYLTPSGKCYHVSKECCNYTKIVKFSDAKRMGLSQCSKCNSETYKVHWK